MDSHSQTESTLPESTLLEHAGFVRALTAGLVADPNRADDISQDALVRAIEHPPRDPRSLRAWLARVARRLASRSSREQRRRERRERAVARTEVAQSDPAREDVLAALTDAVLALDEPYRSTVLARYYEARSAQEIATAEGCSVHTVHGRLRRAHALLRARLDREVPGGRARWTVALCTLTGTPTLLIPDAPVHGLTRSSIEGLITVSTNTKIVLTATALLLLALFTVLFAGLPGGARAPADPPAVASSPTGVRVNLDPRAGPAVARAAVDTSPDLEASNPPEPQTHTASVLLRVSYASDHSPAVGRNFRIYAFDDANPLRTCQSVQTDHAGEARVDGLTPGAINLYGDVGGGDRVQVAAGELTTVEITIPLGVELHGTVVDDQGVRVAGAEVWVSDYGNDDQGCVVARSDERGEFQVRDLGDGRTVCAFASDHAPSRLMRVVGEPGHKVEVTLPLGPRGAALSGRAIDPLGRGIAELELQLEFRRAPDRFGDRNLAPRTSRTDESGRFEFDGLATGIATLLVRTRSQFAPRELQIELGEGEARSVLVELSPRGRVVGVVRDESGRPVARAELRQGPYAGFLSTLTRTDPDGRFVLDALPLGEIEVQVEKDGVGKARSTLRMQSDTELEWNPILRRGLGYVARIVDDLGRGRPGWKVFATARKLEGSGAQLWSRSATSDAAGRFEITGCPDAELQLEIRAPQYTPVEIAVHRARPGAAEDTIVIAADDLPSASVTGILLDADGRPCAGTIAARRQERSFAYETFADGSTGRFELTDLLPGPYTITFSSDDRPTERIARLTLTPSAHEDLGTLQLEQLGHLRVTVRGGEGIREPIEELWITTHVGDGKSASPTSMRVIAGTLEPIPLRPGRYDVTATGTEIVREIHTVTIRAGETASLALDPQTGEGCSFVLGPMNATATPSIVALVVRDATGLAITSWSSLSTGEGPWTTAQRIPRGSFQLTVFDASPESPRAADGTQRTCGELEITVPPGGGQWRVELR